MQRNGKFREKSQIGWWLLLLEVKPKRVTLMAVTREYCYRHYAVSTAVYEGERSLVFSETMAFVYVSVLSFERKVYHVASCLPTFSKQPMSVW